MFNPEEKAGFAWIALCFALTVGLVFVVFRVRSRRPPAAPPVRATSELQLATLEGRVVDASTGEALALYEATIRLEGLEGVSGHYLEPSPDDDPGRFFLRAIPVDVDFRLSVAVPGRLTLERALRFTSGDTIDLGDLGLKSLVRIAARVVDPWDRPVAAALLFGVEENGKLGFDLTSDADGCIRSELLPPGRYQLESRTEGFEALPLPALDLSNGDCIDSLRIELAPVLEMTAVLHQCEEWRASPDGRRDPTRWLEASTTRLKLRRALGADLLEMLDATEDDSLDDAVPTTLWMRIPRYAGEQDVAFLRVPPRRPLEVVAHGTFSTKLPIRARTCITEQPGLDCYSYSTREGVVEDPVELELHQGSDLELLALAPNAAAATFHSDRFPLESSGPSAPIVLYLKPGITPAVDWTAFRFRSSSAESEDHPSDPPQQSRVRLMVSGRVEDNAGPKPGALATVLRLHAAAHRSLGPWLEWLSATACNGVGEFRIEIDSWSADRLFVRVEAPGCAAASEPVRPGLHLEIRLQQACSAAFRILDPDGRPLPFANVRLHLPSAYTKLPMDRPAFRRLALASTVALPDISGCVHAVSDANGEVRFTELPCGDFEVSHIERFQHRLAKTAAFSLGPGEFRRLDDVACERSFALLGWVRNIEGATLDQEVTVSLEGASGPTQATAPVDAEGRFLFTALNSLPLTIRVEAPGYETARWQCAAIPTDIADIRLSKPAPPSDDR